MRRSQKRLLGLISALPVLIVVVALVYSVGMRVLEGEERGFWDSLQFAAETLSTTGYGADASWSHPVMVVLVVLVQFMGVFLIFLLFPIYLIPFLEERFQTRLPESAPEVPGSVVIYRYGPAVATLIDELGGAGVPVVVIEELEATARALQKRGVQVVFGRLDDGVLGCSGLGAARTLVVNGADDENAAAILGARQLRFEGEILALVEEPNHRKPMALAGATAVFTPRHILGAALAARASERISPRIEGATGLGSRLIVSEVRVGRESDLAGKTLRQTRVGLLTGVTVMGQWVKGHLQTLLTADTRLVPGGILVVAGGAESIGRFTRLCGGTGALRRDGPFVLAGYGEVGMKVAQLLREAGEEVQVIDRAPGDGVDLVGDVLDHRVLERSRATEAQAVILAVDSDSATLFATVILKDFVPDVPVIARVNQAQNVERIHHAGADFALSISDVAGQILAGQLLGQESLSLGGRLKLVTVSARGLEGGHPVDLAIRERTGASIVAVERCKGLIVEFDPDFRFEDGDSVYISGSAEATQAYLDVFPQV